MKAARWDFTIERGAVLARTLRRLGAEGSPLALAGPAPWEFYRVVDGVVVDKTTPTFTLTGTVLDENGQPTTGDDGVEVTFRMDENDTLALPDRALYIHLMVIRDPAVDGPVNWISGHARARRGEL